MDDQKVFRDAVNEALSAPIPDVKETPWKVLPKTYVLPTDLQERIAYLERQLRESNDRVQELEGQLETANWARDELERCSCTA